MSVGILFPGQGSQFVGMGADLFEARPDLLGEKADEILGFSLKRLCLEGPEVDLTRTEHAQPSLFALSYALWEEFALRTGVQPEGAAGHSLGEYTALTAAGVFDYETGLGLVSLRGRAMARAADAVDAGMAALLGADRGAAEELSRRRVESGGNLQVANVNAPEQVVMAGTRDDLSWLADNAADLGVRKVIPLNVAGAFHTDLMSPARSELGSALETSTMANPRFPVWSNTTARPHQPGTVSSLLARQLVEPVLFSDSLLDMSAGGIDTFIHVGPGDVTAGLARKTVPGATVHVVSGLEDIPSVAGAVVTIGRS